MRGESKLKLGFFPDVHTIVSWLDLTNHFEDKFLTSSFALIFKYIYNLL